MELSASGNIREYRRGETYAVGDRVSHLPGRPPDHVGEVTWVGALAMRLRVGRSEQAVVHFRPYVPQQ